MHAYGDESGHLRSLLTGDDDIFVLAVVAGEEQVCVGCPKRAVRRVTDLQEAKWNDMSAPEKRRVIDCFSEESRGLYLGYIALKAVDLHALPNSYLLHQDRPFEIPWDLAFIAFGYSTLLSEIYNDVSADLSFTFDRLFGRKQSEQISRQLEVECSEIQVQHATSHGTVGIQAADCVAGAVADRYRKDRNWLDGADVDVECRTAELLTQIKRRLRNSDKTGP